MGRDFTYSVMCHRIFDINFLRCERNNYQMMRSRLFHELDVLFTQRKKRKMLMYLELLPEKGR